MKKKDNDIDSLIRSNEIFNKYSNYIFNERSEGKIFLDLSCGKRKDIKKIVESYKMKWVGIDIVKSIDVIYADAHSLPFEDNSFDIVYSAASFEYYKNPYKVGQEVKRVLKNDGLFLGLIPFLQPWHNSYYHFSHIGVENFLTILDFNVINICAGVHHALPYLIKRMFLFKIGLILSFLSKGLIIIRKILFKIYINILIKDSNESKIKAYHLEIDSLIYATSIVFIAQNKK